MTFLTPIFVMVSVSLVLEMFLVLTDKFLGEYGDCRLLINSEKEFTVKGGSSIHSYLTANKIFIPSACYGKTTCGLCKGKVITDVGPLLPNERHFMNTEEIADNTRLLCEVKVKKDIEILIPREYFLIKEFRTTVESITPLTHNTRMFRLKLEEPNEISFKPGQFIQFRIPKQGEERAYSIASSPNDRNIVELIVRNVPGGLCTTFMFNKLKVGDTIYFTGPYGEFYLREETNDPIIFVAGGSRIAPILSIIKYLSEKNSKRKIISFYGAKTPEEIYFTDYYTELTKNLKDFIHFSAISEPAEGDDWDGEKGLITEVIERYLTEVSNYEAYMCGPPAMLYFTTILLKKFGIDENRIYFEKF